LLIKARQGVSITETKGANLRDLEQLDRELQQFLHNIVDPKAPVYGQARATFAGPVRMTQAGNRGRLAYGSNLRSDLLQRELSLLETEGEKQLYRLGWLQGIGDDIGNVKLNKRFIDFSGEFFGGSVNRQTSNRLKTIQALFQDPGDAEAVTRYIHREARLYEVAAQRGKRPVSIMSEAAEEIAGHSSMMPQGVTGGVSMSRGGLPKPYLRAMSTALRGARRPFLREVSNEISTIFLRGATSPGELPMFLQTLRGTYSRDLQRQMAQAAAGGLTAGQQAQQFAADPMGAATTGVEVGTSALAKLFGAIVR